MPGHRRRFARKSPGRLIPAAPAARFSPKVSRSSVAQAALALKRQCLPLLTAVLNLFVYNFFFSRMQLGKPLL